MNTTHSHNVRGAAAVLILTLCAWAVLMMTGCGDAPKPAAAAKKADDKTKVSQTSTNEVVFETKSVFEDDPKTTKDPFFPTSKRRIAKAAPGKSSLPQAPKIAEIRLKGVIGSPGRFIAMINDKTFAEGEKSQVLVGPGQNLVIKVTKITANSATVVVDGESAPRELSLDTIKEARK
jgi:hypothetical protein